MNNHASTKSSILLIKPKCPSVVINNNEYYYQLNEQLKQSKISCDVILLPEIPISTYNNDNDNDNDDGDNIITYHKNLNPCDIDTSWIIPSLNNNNNDNTYNNNNYGGTTDTSNNNYIASFSNCKIKMMLIKNFNNNNVVSSIIPVEMNPSTFHFDLPSAKHQQPLQPLRLEMNLEVIDWKSTTRNYNNYESSSSSSSSSSPSLLAQQHHEQQQYHNYHQHQDNKSTSNNNSNNNNNNNNANMQLQEILQQETKNLYYILTILGITLASVYIFATHKLLQQPKHNKMKNNISSSSTSSSSNNKSSNSRYNRSNNSSNRSILTKRTLATKKTSCSTIKTNTGRSSRRRHNSAVRSATSRRHSSTNNINSTLFASSPESDSNYDNDNDSYSSFSYSTILTTSKGPSYSTPNYHNKSVCSKSRKSNCSKKSYHTNSRSKSSKAPISMIHLENEHNNDDDNMMIKEEDEDIYCSSGAEKVDQKCMIQNNNLFFKANDKNNQSKMIHHQKVLVAPSKRNSHYPSSLTSSLHNKSRLMSNNMNAFVTNTSTPYCNNNNNSNNFPTTFPTLPTNINSNNIFHFGTRNNATTTTAVSTKNIFLKQKKKQQQQQNNNPFLLSQCNQNNYPHDAKQIQINANNLECIEQQNLLLNNDYQQSISSALPQDKKQSQHASASSVATKAPFIATSYDDNDNNKLIIKKSISKSAINASTTASTKDPPLSPTSKLAHQFKISKSLRRKKFLLMQQKNNIQEQNEKNNNKISNKNVITPDNHDNCGNNNNLSRRINGSLLEKGEINHKKENEQRRNNDKENQNNNNVTPHNVDICNDKTDEIILELSEKEEQINNEQKEIGNNKHAMIASDKPNDKCGDDVTNKTVSVQKEGKIVEISSKFSTTNAQYKDVSQPGETTKSINPSSPLTSPASSDKMGIMTKEGNSVTCSVSTYRPFKAGSSYKSNQNDTKPKSVAIKEENIKKIEEKENNDAVNISMTTINNNNSNDKNDANIHNEVNEKNNHVFNEYWQ